MRASSKTATISGEFSKLSMASVIVSSRSFNMEVMLGEISSQPLAKF